MTLLKAKSLVPTRSDHEMERDVNVRYMSFEAAIDLFQQYYSNSKDKPIGYRVTDHGIEIVYD